MGNLFTISAQRGGAYYRGGLDRAFTVLCVVFETADEIRFSLKFRFLFCFLFRLQQSAVREGIKNLQLVVSNF